MRLPAALVITAAIVTPLLAEGEPEPRPGESSPAAVTAPPAAAPLTSALQGNEGVRIQTMCTNCNAANIDLGGLGDELLPIDLDGREILGGLQTVYVLSVTPRPLLGDIRVDKGPGDFRAPGEAVGGSIRIGTVPPGKRPGFQAGGETGSFSWNGAHANASFERNGFWASGLYVSNRMDPVDADGDGFNETGDLTRTYGAAEVGYRSRGGWVASAGATGIGEDVPDGHGKYSFLESRRRGEPSFLPEDTFIDLDGRHVGLDGPVGDRGTLRVRASRSVRGQDTFTPISFIDEPREPRYFIEDRNAAATARYEHLLGDRGLVSGGILRRRQVLDVENFEAVFEGLAETTDVFHNEGADAGVLVDLSSRWHLRAGVRYDRWKTKHTEGEVEDPTVKIVRERKWSTFSPRARLTWKPAESWAVTFSAGRGARAARPIFAVACCGQRYQSNIDVNLETSSAGSVDIVWQPRPAWRFGAFVQRTSLREHIIRMVGTSQLGIQTYVQANIPRAEYTGLVVTSRLQPWRPVRLDLAWSWLDARSAGERPAVANFHPPTGSRLARHEIPMDRVPYRPIRTGSASLRWSDPRGRFEFDLIGQYQGPMQIQQWHRGFRRVRPTPQLGLRYEPRWTRSFWTVNARIGYRPRPWIALHLGVDNAGDTIQDDLDNPTTDYNWGPLRGRYTYGGITFTL